MTGSTSGMAIIILRIIERSESAWGGQVGFKESTDLRQRVWKDVLWQLAHEIYALDYVT